MTLNLLPTERSCQKVHMKYEGPKSYQFKDMTYVKGFCRQTDRRTDKQTGQKLNAPDLSMQGHKNTLFWIVRLYIGACGHSFVQMEIEAFSVCCIAELIENCQRQRKRICLRKNNVFNNSTAVRTFFVLTLKAPFTKIVLFVVSVDN